mmetsp:Transcript_74725/g.118910  ORF Transcript_74725/g.118910 Transcript_74725/m.118910 type:complete len:426 (-) Transcript_74725:107-1384(-)
MQVSQSMELDSENQYSHHPIKGQVQQKLNVQKRGNRAFGQDLTNQQRSSSSSSTNQDTHPNVKQYAKSNPNGRDSFDAMKKPKIVVKSDSPKQISSHKSKQHRSSDPEPVCNEGGESSIDAMDTDIVADLIFEDETQPWDATDADNELFVTDYVNDIMSSLRSDEASHCGVIENEMDFMAFQEDVNARMRTVLVDWLVEVHRKFKLVPATYFLGINLLDRYLAKKQLHRKQLQLCGCTCLWVASKYHEIYAPEMDDFVYISDNAFTPEDLMRMEIDVLKTLSFTLTVPTCLNYAQRYSKISSYYLKQGRERKIISDLIMYCVEHSVMSYTLCRKLPSLVGAASFVYSCIATKVFSMSQFENDGLSRVIGYEFSELIPTMLELDNILKNARRGKHKAVYKKYCNSKFSNIGKLNFDKLNTSFLNQN